MVLVTLQIRTKPYLREVGGSCRVVVYENGSNAELFPLVLRSLRKTHRQGHLFSQEKHQILTLTCCQAYATMAELMYQEIT